MQDTPKLKTTHFKEYAPPPTTDQFHKSILIMDANTRKLERIFDQTITYQVPLFQRPYVWTKKENWEPLWEDIQSLLDKYLRGETAHPHFLGAVVLEQLPNPCGSIESRQVIDGQQRFTTLQLFLIAARDHATANEKSKYIERFSDLVANRKNKIDNDEEVYKVWPTNSNRAAYCAVHEARSPTALDKAIKLKPSISDGSNNVIDAYKYFHSQLESWLNGSLDDKEDASLLSGKTLDDRFDTLWQIVRDRLQVVVIDLHKDDETQVIFETLNARGQDLLPADLIKNYLFRQAVAHGDDVEKLYADHWRRFETTWWRDKIKQGRITRPRVDVFVNYYLVMMTREEVKSSHLFQAFKYFVEQSEVYNGSLLIVPKTPAEHIAQLARYAEVFQSLYNVDKSNPLATFLKRLEAVDTNTIFPFLLYACAELVPGRETELEQIIKILEAFLIRRMVCNLTAKNYNRIFIDLIKTIDTKGALTPTNVSEQMAKSSADSIRFPTDIEFEAAIIELPLYGRLAQFKVRTILEALDIHAHTALSPLMLLPHGLTIEHIMPQSWETYWPLPDEEKTDPLKEQEAIQRRNRLINSLGNLTLVTGSLNPTLSHSAWSVKRPEILKYSKLNLIQYFHGHEADDWNEEKIEKRTKYLAGHMMEIWPAIAPPEKSFNGDEA